MAVRLAEPRSHRHPPTISFCAKRDEDGKSDGERLRQTYRGHPQKLYPWNHHQKTPRTQEDPPDHPKQQRPPR